MQTLILDAGNTRINGAVWEDGAGRPFLVEPAGVALAPPVPLRAAGPFDHPNGVGPAAFQASFSRVHEGLGRPSVVLATVVPEIMDLLPSDVRPEVVDHTSDLPFVLDVLEPAQVGPDRLCNVAAAAGAGLGRALIVDAGTATTFDVLVDGVFTGGMIAPGMAFAAEKLGQTAARLDPVPFGPAGWAAGRDTGAAMAAGAWHAGTGGVRAVVAGLLDHYGELPVIVTGGLGRFLTDQGWYWDPDWTLRGAAIISGR